MNTNTLRESRYVTVARLGYELAQREWPLYSHPKSPQRFTQPQLVACVLLAYYLDMSYRDTEEWLLATDQVCQVLGLKSIPDHSTLSRMAKKLTQKTIRGMIDSLLTRLAVEEEVVAGDSTSFRLSQASAYYQSRRGKSYREWVKGAYVVGIQSKFILGCASSEGSKPDFGFLRPLKRQVARYGKQIDGQRHWFFLGDKGFDARGVSRLDLIPPIRRYGKLVDPKRKARADRVSAARLDGLMGQRWQVEGVNSVVKRKFGDTIRSRSLSMQLREPLLKALVYNIHV
jgi:hypothetical protein